MEQDDAFHLTAVDVRRYDFATVMRGYDRARVDQFKEQVADEIERLMRSNADLEEKARNFHEQLRAFRERDRALNEALVSAQQLRADVKEQATREADLIVREAESEATGLVESARSEAKSLTDASQVSIATLRADIEQLERVRQSYLSHVRALAERQIAEVSAFEGQRRFGEDR